MNWPPTAEDWTALHALQAKLRNLETKQAALSVDVAAAFVHLAEDRQGAEREENARHAFHLLADQQQELNALPPDKFHEGVSEQLDRIPDLIDAALDLVPS